LDRTIIGPQGTYGEIRYERAVNAFTATVQILLRYNDTAGRWRQTCENTRANYDVYETRDPPPKELGIYLLSFKLDKSMSTNKKSEE